MGVEDKCGDQGSHASERGCGIRVWQGAHREMDRDSSS